jgi:hypothetical protein
MVLDIVTDVFASLPSGGTIEPRTTANCMWTRCWFQIFSASSATALKEGEPSIKPPAGPCGGSDKWISTVRLRFQE